jgi:hypothetical protein
LKAAYVGILTNGSTSRMRAEQLRELTPGMEWSWMDTDPPLTGTSRVSQSLAYRFKTGSGVSAINAAVNDWTRNKSFELVWIDKAIFLWPGTVQRIRDASLRLVHFTPDAAFFVNRSRHFEKTLKLFDLLVTTKSFEVDQYRARLQRDTLLVTTQGFDANVHYPRNSNAERKRETVFVGLAEPDRERCVATLLGNGIPVRLAGRGWARFLQRWKRSSNLLFEGEDVFGDDYARLLSGSWVGLGLLSKRFPELHTTRTFEIPACGAVLATERNRETEQFFTADEALFFRSYDDLAEKLSRLFAQDAATLEVIAGAGRNRALHDGRDYSRILSRILTDPRITL